MRGWANGDHSSQSEMDDDGAKRGSGSTCAEVFCLSWSGCEMTVFFCLLSSWWKQLKSQYGGARVGYFDTFSTCMDPVFF